ncbi:MAG: hypothetical protein LWW81_06530, partial [Rhodocyclales bacterium]|nr:hypothetical protein [Rhodocyclales bacterium]
IFFQISDLGANRGQIIFVCRMRGESGRHQGNHQHRLEHVKLLKTHNSEPRTDAARLIGKKAFSGEWRAALNCAWRR